MFSSFLSGYSFEEIKDKIHSADGGDVLRAIQAPEKENMYALFSQSAEEYLESMAAKAAAITKERFGKIIQIYAPLYLSNECSNSCLYCGFSNKNKDIKRRTLTEDEIKRELEVINSMGMRHVLLVSGEAPAKAGIEYLKRALIIAGQYSSHLGIEVYPLDTDGYKSLVGAGADNLTIYQETYDRERYAEVHPKGRKSDMEWRLNAPDRGAGAGMRTVGVGPLLGLSDPATDAFFAVLHALYLTKKYWKTNISISFPRLRHAEGCAVTPHEVSDRMLVQYICAARIMLPDAGIVLSTRERASFRDNMAGLGITQMSAASVTEPGGYFEKDISTAQFAVEDGRSVEEFCSMLINKGYEPVMKDWDMGLKDRH